MSRLTPVPTTVTDSVRAFVYKARQDAQEWENVELLDDGQVYSLYRLAGEIYAAGWDDGHRVGRCEADPIR